MGKITPGMSTSPLGLLRGTCDIQAASPKRKLPLQPLHHRVELLERAVLNADSAAGVAAGLDADVHSQPVLQLALRGVHFNLSRPPQI